MSSLSWICSSVALLVSGCLNLVPAVVLVGRFPLTRLSLKLASALVGWMAVVSLEVLALGHVGWLTPLGLVAMAASVAAVSSWLGWGVLVSQGAAWRREGRGMLVAMRASPVHSLLLGLAIAVIVGRQLFHVWFLPPYVYDVLVYHLPRVADWVREGRIVMQQSGVLRTWWPASFELLQTWVAVFYHHDAFVELPGLICCAVLLLATYSLLRSMRVGRRLGAWLTVATALAPSVLFQAVSCKNDLAVAAVFLLTAAIWLDAEHDVEADAPRWAWSAMSLAWAAGVKPYVILLASGLLPLLIWVSLRRRRHGLAMPLRWCWTRRDLPGLVILVLACGILAGYWYVRNSVRWGNPLYPVAMRIGPWKLPGVEGVYQQGAFSLHTLGTTWHELLSRRLWDSGQAFNPELGNMAGWGWFSVAVGLPLSVVAALRDARLRWLAASGGLAFAALFSAVNADPWNMRFAAWVPPLLAVGAGVGLRSLRHRDIARGFAWLAIMTSVLNLLGGMSNGYYTREEWRGQVKRPLGERRAYSLWDWQLAQIPPDAVVAHRLGDNDPVYLLAGPAMRRRAVHLPDLRIGADILQRMTAVGAEWLFIIDPSGEETAVLQQLSRAGFLREAANGVFQLARIKESADQKGTP